MIIGNMNNANTQLDTSIGFEEPDEITSEWFIEHAKRLGNEAYERDIHLRLVGSISFRILCDETLHRDVLDREIGDIDFVGLKSEKKRIREMFSDAGYTMDKDVLMGSGGSRFVFFHDEHEIDIFLDGIDMCHNLDLRDRLDVGPSDIALNPADLLLEKAQIVDINEKDLKDLALLFLEHPLADDDSGINKPYVLNLLSKHWGFYYTVSQNLSKVKDYADRSPLDKDQVGLIESRINDFLTSLEEEPKSTRWKLRSKVGTRIKWYEDVGQKHRD